MAAVFDKSREQDVAVEALSLSFGGAEVQLAAADCQGGVVIHAEVQGQAFVIAPGGLTAPRYLEPTQEVTGSDDQRRGGGRLVPQIRRRIR